VLRVDRRLEVRVGRLQEEQAEDQVGHPLPQGDRLEVQHHLQAKLFGQAKVLSEVDLQVDGFNLKEDYQAQEEEDQEEDQEDQEEDQEVQEEDQAKVQQDEGQEAVPQLLPAKCFQEVVLEEQACHQEKVEGVDKGEVGAEEGEESSRFQEEAASKVDEVHEQNEGRNQGEDAVQGHRQEVQEQGCHQEQDGLPPAEAGQQEEVGAGVGEEAPRQVSFFK